MLDINDMIGKIHCGDCLEVMKQMPDKCVDLVLTDPPYDDKTHNGAILKNAIDFLANPLIEKLIPEWGRICRGWVISFCSLEMLGDYKKIAGTSWIRAGIWDRVINMPQMTGDRPAQGGEGLAIIHPSGVKKWNGGGKAAIWAYPVERNMKQHPTQKPIELISKLTTQFSNEKQIIFDPFLGSGTTAVAAERLGRRWIGIELEPKYCAIAQARVDAERNQLKLPGVL